MKKDKLQKYIVESDLQCELIYLPEVDSTNDFAKGNINNIPALIITDYQKKGRGRFNNLWLSEAGKNITMTIVEKLIVAPRYACLVNFYTGVILYDVLINMFPSLNISLKWQNDILINGKKAGGILTELVKIYNNEENLSAKNILIGIGLNVNQEKFPVELISNPYKSKNATSLFIETGKIIPLEELAYNILKQFLIFYDAMLCANKILYLWKKYSQLIDKDVEFIKSDDLRVFRGKVIDIESDGAIIILSEKEKKIKFYSGEVHLIY